MRRGSILSFALSPILLNPRIYKSLQSGPKSYTPVLIFAITSVNVLHCELSKV